MNNLNLPSSTLTQEKRPAMVKAKAAVFVLFTRRDNFGFQYLSHHLHSLEAKH
jgi:hypothetical protein